MDLITLTLLGTPPMGDPRPLSNGLLPGAFALQLLVITRRVRWKGSTFSTSPGAGGR